MTAPPARTGPAPIGPGFLADCGTAYAKLLELPSGARSIVPARRVRAELAGRPVLAATGHGAAALVARPANELVALARGATARLPDLADLTVVDCGARDCKCIRFAGGRVAGMDWNTECGSFAGHTLELLRRQLEIDEEHLAPPACALGVTCGVLGMVQLFDRIAAGAEPESAYAELVAGVAENVWRLAGRPERLHLSGGLCDSPAFRRSFPDGVLVPLGRFVMVEGLAAMLAAGDLDPDLGV